MSVAIGFLTLAVFMGLASWGVVDWPGKGVGTFLAVVMVGQAYDHIRKNA